jgi:hypothetical protein
MEPHAVPSHLIPLYAIGEIVHNYFRTRGVTLTSHELPRLVAELLARRQRGRRLPASGPLVRFAGAPSTGTPSFAGPPSPLVTATPREMADIATRVRDRLVGDPSGLSRTVWSMPLHLCLARLGASPAVAVRLRDGRKGLVLFPRAAPVGPVLALRRAEPGEAPLERPHREFRRVSLAKVELVATPQVSLRRCWRPACDGG